MYFLKCIFVSVFCKVYLAYGSSKLCEFVYTHPKPQGHRATTQQSKPLQIKCNSGQLKAAHLTHRKNATTKQKKETISLCKKLLVTQKI